jgi:predicted transcriptional regulator
VKPNRNSVQVPDDAKELLDELSDTRGRSRVNIVGALIRRFYEMTQMEQTAFIGQVDAEAKAYYAQYLRQLADGLDGLTPPDQPAVPQTGAPLLHVPGELRRTGRAKK